MNSSLKIHNQFVIDLYNGLKMGFDELNKESVSFKINVYDTKNDTTVLKRLLYLNELTFSDMIINCDFRRF